MTDTTSELRQQLAAILIKWSMPTRQGAMDDIMQLIAAQKERWEAAAAVEELEEILNMAKTNYEATGNDDMRALATYCGSRIIQIRQRPALDGVIGETE